MKPRNIDRIQTLGFAGAAIVLAVLSALASCVSADQPLDAAKVSASMRTEIREHEALLTALEFEIMPALEVALESTAGTKADPVLIAMQTRIRDLTRNANDARGRGRLIELALNEAEKGGTK